MSSYQCKKCGKISSDKSQICDSGSEITSLYVCSDCDKQSVSAESICRPQEVTPSYYCKKCGSSAAEKTNLCKPETILV